MGTDQLDFANKAVSEIWRRADGKMWVETEGDELFVFTKTRIEMNASPIRLKTSSDPHDLLTPREKAVLLLLRAEKTHEEIAAALHITERTAKFHAENMYAKFGCATRAELLFKFPSFFDCRRPQKGSRVVAS